MGTRSNIGIQNLDGSYDIIYCHWDGYPEHNGKLLYEHYQDIKKIRELIALGDLSSLGANIGKKHDFDKRVEGWCTFYARDRGETNVEAQHYATYDDLCKMLEEAWTEWVYLYRMEDGKWYYTNNPSPTWFKCCGTEQMQPSLLTPEAWQNQGV